ncbi:hypothetical protein [Phocaeicola paurosaccharolyticus]|uniref:hypothetical protein n=1 Tax=Phocaeicola paurosaccharolyticus TaxID=732242 RepID=UPI0004682FBF|nr:hypothetical protein [Phocaeicola paurosaccharolyticus]
MSIYDIHFCSRKELSILQKFIDKFWKKDHILSYSKELFEFQHLRDGQEHYTFVIATNTLTEEIDGVFGYIESQKYDETNTIPNIGWGAVWKVRDDINNKEIGKLGLKMLKFLIKNSPIETFASLGISKTHKDIALSLNFIVNELNHYYIINNCVNDYKIAQNPHRSKPNIKKDKAYISVTNDITNINIESNLNRFKNVSYFVNRYQRHPFFQYEFWVVKNDQNPLLIFAVRRIFVGDSNIYRIVDMIGNLPSTVSLLDEIQRIIQLGNAEYVDCLNYGISPEFFKINGFEQVPFDNSTVIPEHLDPLEHKYIPLEFECMDDVNVVIFKGDGDQDRPNKI